MVLVKVVKQAYQPKGELMDSDSILRVEEYELVLMNLNYQGVNLWFIKLAIIFQSINIVIL